MNSIRNERGEVTTDTTDIPMNVTNYYKQIYAKKLENEGEMNKFLEKYNLPKLNEDKAETLSRSIIPGDIKTLIKKLPAHKALDWMDSEENFIQHLRKR